MQETNRKIIIALSGASGSVYTKILFENYFRIIIYRYNIKYFYILMLKMLTLDIWYKYESAT